jgi:hypothetical protein
MYRRTDAPATPAEPFNPGTALIDPLFGPRPTWRLDEEPLYLEVVAALGSPRRQAVDCRVVRMPPARSDVVEGSLVEGAPTVPLDLAPTTSLPVLPIVEAAKPRPPRKRTPRKPTGS